MPRQKEVCLLLQALEQEGNSSSTSTVTYCKISVRGRCTQS
jgi:hypothetical protein